MSALGAAFPATPARAQGASDIFLLRVDQKDGKVTVTNVNRVTKDSTYNNQPAFLRDGTLLYTHQTVTPDMNQMDIWSAVFAEAPHPFTKTQDQSEYSAAQIPGSDRIAAITVEKDSTQRLWHFDAQGMAQGPLIKNLKPIGYQAWVDANHVAVFVLGDAPTRAPSTLQLVDIRDESAIPIASGIGRALQPVPGKNAVSFTRRDSANTRWIDMYDVSSKTITHVAKTLPENEYHVWMPNGLLVSARGSSLYQLMPGQDADWVLAADLASHGVKGITRIAVSVDGKQIAIVAAR